MIVQCAAAKGIEGLTIENKIEKGNLPDKYFVEQSSKEMIGEKIDEEIIRVFDCMEESMANAEISLNPPLECKLEDGSAYHRPIRKKAQILERVRRIPVKNTSCMIQWWVNVGWCGGEFAIESYMHVDIETLRSTIIPTKIQCNEADPDGTISITTPGYGSIQPLDLKLKLQGGKWERKKIVQIE